MPIDLPQGVTADIDPDNNHITVKGPKGTLERTYHADMSVARSRPISCLSRGHRMSARIRPFMA